MTRMQTVFFRRDGGGEDQIDIPASEDPTKHIHALLITRVEVHRALTRHDALQIARSAAFNSRERHHYMPATESSAKRWYPHEWVIEAIIAASVTTQPVTGQIVSDSTNS